MKFTAWAMGVFRNKKSDFLRKKYQWREGMEKWKHELERQNSEFDFEMRFVEKIDFIRLVNTLRSTADENKCSKLFLLLYEAYQRKEPGKNVAKLLGITNDAFRQRLRRCRAEIIALLGQESAN